MRRRVTKTTVSRRYLRVCPRGFANEYTIVEFPASGVDAAADRVYDLHIEQGERWINETGNGGRITEVTGPYHPRTPMWWRDTMIGQRVVNGW